MDKPVRSEIQWQSAVEQQIREAMARGEFDNLPGKGKPIPGLDGTHDEEWWVKQKLKRERLSYLPPALALRKEVEDARAKIRAAESEVAVRELVAQINERIVHVNSRITSGPASTVMRLDVEETVLSWRNAGRPTPRPGRLTTESEEGRGALRAWPGCRHAIRPGTVR